MRIHRLTLVAVAAAILGCLAWSTTWVVGEGHRAMVAQVQAGQRMAATDRASGLGQDLAALPDGVHRYRSATDRHQAYVDVSVGGRIRTWSLVDLSPAFLNPLPGIAATTSLATRDGRVLLSNSPVTSPRVQSPEMKRLLAAGRQAAATYHSPVLDTDRIGVVAPVPGTDLMVVLGTDAAVANRPAEALVERLLLGLAVTTTVVGVLSALLLLLLQRGRRRLRAERDAAEDLARTDTLTGLPNRRAFDAAVAGLDHSDRLIGVVAIDLDHLKLLNDRLGHEAGDEALHAAARAMDAVLRPGDLLARVGGDEFVLLLDGADRQRSEQVAARVRAAVATHAVDGYGQLAISTGVSAGPGRAVPSVLRDADDALYRHKRARAVHA